MGILNINSDFEDEMKRHEIKKYKKYRILYPDSYKGKIAEARGVDSNGDVTLEFKNGKQVSYHAGWLEDVITTN